MVMPIYAYTTLKYSSHTMFYFFFTTPYSDVMCSDCVELFLRVNSMQLSLIFWQHFWGQTTSRLPCHLPYTMFTTFTLILAKSHKSDQNTFKSTPCKSNVRQQLCKSPCWRNFDLIYAHKGDITSLLQQLYSTRSSRQNIFWGWEGQGKCYQQHVQKYFTTPEH